MWESNGKTLSPCVLAASQQRERCSYAFYLEITTALSPVSTSRVDGPCWQVVETGLYRSTNRTIIFTIFLWFSCDSRAMSLWPVTKFEFMVSCPRIRVQSVMQLDRRQHRSSLLIRNSFKALNRNTKPNSNPNRDRTPVLALMLGYKITRTTGRIPEKFVREWRILSHRQLSKHGFCAVSYTHLTLPTIYSV